MKEIKLGGKLGKGKVTVVDDADYEVLSKQSWGFDGFYVGAFIKGTGKRQRLHRFLMKPSKNMEVDHVNGNRLDNRRSNLRICTHSENQMNKSADKNSISQYKGVSKTRTGWRAYISFKHKHIFIGSYETEIEAAKAYDEWATDLYREYAKLNFQ